VNYLDRNIVYEKILQTINTGLIIVNEKYEILMINREALKILNIKSKKNSIPEKLLNNISFEKSIERCEIELNKKIIGATITPLKDGEKKICVVIFRDITEIKNSYEERRRRENLALLGEVAVYIAHEVRNPLNLIKGFSQLMTESDDLEFIKENAKIVISEADRLNRLASTLLNYTKNENFKSEEINIYTFIKLMIVNLNLENIIEVEKIGKEIIINADKEKMVQVFLNIIKNGVEAIEGQENRIFKIKMINRDKINIIEFQTNGKIDEKLDIKKIFNPFITTKSNGNGLGLAIVKKIIEAHNMKIYCVKNRIGGLSFKIYGKIN
jgi:two-component system, sporulation sensor kinase E